MSNDLTLIILTLVGKIEVNSILVELRAVHGSGFGVHLQKQTLQTAVQAPRDVSTRHLVFTSHI
jgi:hypothetical protein